MEVQQQELASQTVQKTGQTRQIQILDNVVGLPVDCEPEKTIGGCDGHHVR